MFPLLVFLFHLLYTFLVDVNRAKIHEWKKLNGCTDQMASLLIRLQLGGVQLSGAEDLFQLLELPDHIAEQWKPHLIFRWYGNTPYITKQKLVRFHETALVYAV